MRHRYIHLILLLLLLGDTTYSFLQHYHEPLDGDMSGIVLPSEVFHPLMEDPFGFNVLFRDHEYKDPNRFFAHWFMSKYFKSIPFLLQFAVDPITSIYLASAIMKILIQVLIIFMLASLISGSKNIFNREFIIAAFLVAPLIQVTGYYYLDMGIIDRSITYAMFYALPLGLLTDIFLSILQSIIRAKEDQTEAGPGYFNDHAGHCTCFKWSTCFRCGTGIVFRCIDRKMVDRFRPRARNPPSQAGRWKPSIIYPKNILLYFGIFMLFSFYSLFIARNNISIPEDTLSVSDRYLRLPKGLFLQLTSKPGFCLFLGSLH